MASSEWQLSLKLTDQPKSTFHFPEMMPGDVSPGEYRVATLKQLVAAQLPDSIPDPDLIGWFQLESKWFHQVAIMNLCLVQSGDIVLYSISPFSIWFQNWSTVDANSKMT